jgi:hypothetical protein
VAHEEFQDPSETDILGWVSYAAEYYQQHLTPPTIKLKVNKRCTFWVAPGCLPAALAKHNHSKLGPMGGGGYGPPTKAIIEVTADCRRMRIAEGLRGLENVRAIKTHFLWDDIAVAGEWVTLDPDVEPSVQSAITNGSLSRTCNPWVAADKPNPCSQCTLGAPEGGGTCDVYPTVDSPHLVALRARVKD